jgi:PAS domain S-box-containing protein
MKGPVAVEDLDLSTFLEVSQALSGEIALERLIDTLLRLAVEHSGAGRGVLVLPRGAGWQAEAEAFAGPDGVTVRVLADPVSTGLVPQSILAHVVRTKEHVVIEDASAPDAFPSDVYFRQKRVRSLLCLPLLKRGELIAVLYLENGLAADAFTPPRLAILTLLVSEAAIALENARLHRELREHVADLTERRRAEEALRLSTAYNRSLIEASLDPLVTIGPDGKITDVNAATETATGRSRGELIGTDFCDYFTEPATARAGYEQAFREGTVRDYPLELRHRDGPVMSVLYNASVYRDESGRVIGVFAAARDVTERKRAEDDLRKAYGELRASRDALRLSEAYLAEAQRLSHTGSWAYDVTASRYVYLSEECFRIFELDPEGELPGREQVSRLIHPEDWGRVNQSFEKSTRERVDTSSEFRLALPGGRTKHVLAFRHPVLNDAGEIVELVGTVIDITERKCAEEALHESEDERRRAEVAAQEARAQLERLARLKTMGELAASIAHELNQPLAGLVTSADAGLNWLAADPPNVAKAREALTRVVRDGTRAGEVVARIRGAVKRAASVMHRVNINDIVGDVLPLMVGELRQRQVEVSLGLDPGVPDVLGDAIQLQQVLLNLVKNGIEAMADVEDRPRALGIASAVTELAGNPAVVLKVSDTGPGIGLADPGRLFEPFQTTKPGGMGMGLWISRLILEAHNGRLTAHANDGPGATFEILLPAMGGDPA